MSGETGNAAGTGRQSFSIKEFCEGVKAEYSKIIFPSREDLKKETIATIAVSVFIGLLIFGLDAVLKMLLGLVL